MLPFLYSIILYRTEKATEMERCQEKIVLKIQ